ncbi:MAG: type IV pilin protein [Stagnimonas sp.]|nr:type IV pilin protein [Stagnimonas sp.]
MSLSTPRHAERGFTIIELLIVIVIISILVALAVPSYREYVMRTNRTVAKAALQELATRQESYAVDHKGYAVNFDRLGIAGSGAATVAYVTSGGTLSRNSADALYSFALNSDTAGTMSTCALQGSPSRLGFRISAAPVVASTDSRCGTLCVGSNGDRGASAGVAAECWRR